MHNVSNSTKIHTTPLFIAWVKNVYSVCVPSFYTRKTSVRMPTETAPHYIKALMRSVQSTIITRTINTLPPSQYTAFIRKLHLLSTTYTQYPQPLLLRPRN